MEMTLENKAKFFAQYWGQEVVFHRNSRPEMVTFESMVNSVSIIDGYSLYLKPISSISDEDAMAITIYWAFKPKNLTEYGYTDIRGFQFYAYSSVDFLRSKGYAMPFHDLRVDQMVNAGWIKLQEA